MIPKKLFFTKGVGVHKDRLTSFELALREAGVEKCNLVSVSASCRLIAGSFQRRGIKSFKPGPDNFLRNCQE